MSRFHCSWGGDPQHLSRLPLLLFLLLLLLQHLLLDLLVLLLTPLLVGGWLVPW